MNTFEEVWENVCDYCKDEISGVAYNCWIKTLSPVKLHGKVAVVSAPTKYQRDLTESHYKELLERAFSEVFRISGVGGGYFRGGKRSRKTRARKYHRNLHL